MLNVNEYRRIIKQVLEEYNFYLSTYSYLNSKLIISEDKNVYLIVIYGSHNNKRIHDYIVHIDLNKTQNAIEVFRNDINVKLRLHDAGIPWKQFGDYYYKPEIVIDSIISFEKIYNLHKTIFTAESNHQKLVIKPDATPAELTELSVVEHTEIGRAIATHLNTPPDLLIKLFCNFTAEVFAHPTFERLLLTQSNLWEKLYQVYPGVFHQKGLKIPSAFIEWAINHEEESVRANIASTHDISAYYLEKLVDDESCIVIAYLVARTCYPSSDPETHFSSSIMNKVCNRYRKFIDNCSNKNICCECEDIVANV